MKQLVLGDSLEALIDYRGKTPKKLGTDFTQSGVPVASAILVASGRLDLSDPRFVSTDTWRMWMTTPTRKGDVLLTSEAPLGRVARVPSDEPLVLGQRLFALRGKTGVLDNGYLFYALQTERVQSDLIGRSTGTTVFGIRQSALRHVTIPAPGIDEQRAIAEVLGALDDKIAANTSVVASAEGLMTALASTATETAQVRDLARHTTASRRPDEFDSAVSHFSLPAFDQGGRPEVTSRQSIKSNKFVVDRPSVLMSKLNPRIPRIWNVPVVPDRMALASTEFVVLEPLAVDASALWAVLAQPDVSATLTGKVSGTSGSHQRVKPGEVLSLEVRDPRCLTPAALESIAALGLIAHARWSENQVLAGTRDVMLPQLMSGKVRSRDAERVVEEVV